MEPPITENKNPEVSLNVSTISSSNQLIPDNLELPDDTFRMSLDNFSMIGENVTIGRETSVDSTPTAPIPYTPSMQLATPDVETPPELTAINSPPIVETPKPAVPTPEIRKPQTLLQLSLTKKNENDVFVKPSPVLEVMSPAKMLQFEIEASSATPTMKRAAIDFDFFNKNNFEKYFVDDSVKNKDNEVESSIDGSTYKETPVIVKADTSTVRHEIGYDATTDKAKTYYVTTVSYSKKRHQDWKMSDISLRRLTRGNTRPKPCHLPVSEVGRKLFGKAYIAIISSECSVFIIV